MPRKKLGAREFHLLGVGLVEDVEPVLGRFVPPDDDALEVVLEVLEDAAQESAKHLLVVVTIMVGVDALLRCSSFVAAEAKDVVDVVGVLVVAAAAAAAREGESAERKAASETKVPANFKTRRQKGLGTHLSKMKIPKKTKKLVLLL